MAVQSLIYEVDLAYQPDGRLAVEANGDEACDIPDKRATPVWRMEESSRNRTLLGCDDMVGSS